MDQQAMGATQAQTTDPGRNGGHRRPEGRDLNRGSASNLTRPRVRLALPESSPPPADEAAVLPAAVPTGFESGTATANGVRLHYVRGGSGYPVVLIHGFGQTWYEWRKVMPALAERYEVIAPDLRGMGDSAPAKSGFDKRTAAEDVYQLLQRLGLESVRLVGHDVGVMVAYAYAAAHPEEVRRLVLFEGVIPDESIYTFPSITPKGEGLWDFGFFMAGYGMAEFLVSGRERGFLERFFRILAHNQDAFTDADLDEYARTQRDPAKLRASFEYFRAFPEDVAQNREYARTKLRMPVLALGGEYSPGNVIVEQAKRYATDVRGGVVPGSGHWIPEERPEDFQQQLLEFFDGDA